MPYLITTPRPAADCLDLERVEGATFWPANELWTGVVAIDAGQELDVRQVAKRRWYASDDAGVRHFGRTVKRAVQRAIDAN